MKWYETALLCILVAIAGFIMGVVITGKQVDFWVERAHEYKLDADRISQQYYEQFIIRDGYIFWDNTVDSSENSTYYYSLDVPDER